VKVARPVLGGLGVGNSPRLLDGEDVRPAPSGILVERGSEGREAGTPFYGALCLEVGEFMDSLS